jgi:hypothetical protein
MIYVKDSGTWKEVEKVFIKDAGVWKETTQVSLKDVTWKEVHAVNPVIPNTLLHTFDSDIRTFTKKDGVMYAFLDDNSVHTSINGSSWTNIGNKTNINSDDRPIYGAGYFWDIDHYNAGNWNYKMRIYRSSDGLTFSNVKTVNWLNEDHFGSDDYYNVSDGLSYWTTSDGSSWTQNTGPVKVFGTYGSNIMGVDSHNGQFYEGTTFSNLTQLGTINSASQVTKPGGVAYYNNKYVVSFYKSETSLPSYYSFAYSDDGDVWNYVDKLDITYTLHEINGYLVSGRTWSVDGVNWKLEDVSEYRLDYVQENGEIYANSLRSIYKYDAWKETLTNFETQSKIIASDGVSGDNFGESVSISGDYAIVGALNEDTGANNAGAAYIFHKTGVDTWDSGTKIMASDAEADDNFGMSVSIDGDYAIVGAGAEDTGGDDSGAAYIFHRTGTNTWDGGVKLVSPNPEANGRFGDSVSISGDYAIVGTRFEDSPDNSQGAAYIFHRTGTNTWDSGTKITNGGSYDYFGSAVSISGDYVIVGATGDDEVNSGAGATYIFHRTGTNTWDGGIKITRSDVGSYKEFGKSVAISGDYAVVGCRALDVNGISHVGAIYIFDRTGTNTWNDGIKIESPDVESFAWFGTSVSISGDYVIAGANSINDSTGAAYIFKRDTTTNTWDAGTKITAENGSTYDNFGESVSISGQNIIVGTPGDDTTASNSGAVYIFR